MFLGLEPAQPQSYPAGAHAGPVLVTGQQFAAKQLPLLQNGRELSRAYGRQAFRVGRGHERVVEEQSQMGWRWDQWSSAPSNLSSKSSLSRGLSQNWLSPLRGYFSYLGEGDKSPSLLRRRLSLPGHVGCHGSKCAVKNPMVFWFLWMFIIWHRSFVPSAFLCTSLLLQGNLQRESDQR